MNNKLYYTEMIVYKKVGGMEHKMESLPTRIAAHNVRLYFMLFGFILLFLVNVVLYYDLCFYLLFIVMVSKF